MPCPHIAAASTGPNSFRDDVLERLGGADSARQFEGLLEECRPLMEAASALPPLSLRSDKWAAVTMLRCPLVRPLYRFRCFWSLLGTRAGPSVPGGDAAAILEVLITFGSMR